MTHHASPAFWRTYEALSPQVRDTADKSFALLKSDPQHPSVRVSRRYRALATQVPDGFLWFWIGTHEEYQRLTGT